MNCAEHDKQHEFMIVCLVECWMNFWWCSRDNTTFLVTIICIIYASSFHQHGKFLCWLFLPKSDYIQADVKIGLAVTFWSPYWIIYGDQTWLKRVQNAKLNRHTIKQWGLRLFSFLEFIKSDGPLSQKKKQRKLFLKLQKLTDSLEAIRGPLTIELNSIFPK